MGNNKKKFKFSDMIPNSWFYKLKDNMISRSRNRSSSDHALRNNNNNKETTTSPTTTSQRSHHSNFSHCFFSIQPNHNNSPIFTKHSDTIFTDSSSSKRRRRFRRRTTYKPSPPTFVSSPVLESWTNKPSNRVHRRSPEFFASSSPECVSSESESDDEFAVCRVSSSTNDIIIDMNSESFSGGKTGENLDGFDAVSRLGLAPILTKPAARFDNSVKEAKELRSTTKFDGRDERARAPRDRKTGPIARKSSANNSVGIKLRVNSPKLASRKLVHQAYARRTSVSSKSASGFPDGFAVVKFSVDPQKDFRDSMAEMIAENDIRASKDLENLLASYLSLNSSEYHDLIVKAFEQIWYDMTQLKL